MYRERCVGSRLLWTAHTPGPKTKKIYTDWANHYLDKSKSRRHIHDLQADVSDGVVLAEVIEAVTGQKVPDINKKPKNSTQMLENISASLAYLAGVGVALDGLTAKDIKDGNLKAILSLFFALSRYKQQQKQAQQERKELEKLREKKQESEMVTTAASKLGSPYKGHGSGGGGGGGSAIPTPALGGRRPTPEHHSRIIRSATPVSSSGASTGKC
ncbi:neuron navigator 3-like isoform X2 [Cherax quadricarinatus]|uniref:neuron navigator 3-like isoform X2 n=1 Tax=Cherax quadricarinatus TaxID=27406 RepID=UPI00387EA6E4